MRSTFLDGLFMQKAPPVKDNIETSTLVGTILDFYYLMPEGMSWSDIGCISEDEGPYAFCDFPTWGLYFKP